MTKLLTALAAASAFAALAAAPSLVLAKAGEAATADSGKGCLVADANGAYTFDANCDYHIVTRHSGGALVLVSYHDHGTLPDGAPRPSSARRNPVTSVVGGRTCEGTETTTPSGDYSSDCHFNDSH